MLEVAKRFGPEATILTVIPDGGRWYLSKFFDDNWMLEHGFLERTRAAADGRARCSRSSSAEDTTCPTSSCRVAPEGRRRDRADAALRRSRSCRSCRDGPAESLADIVGSLNERGLLDRVFRNPDALGEDVAVAMQPPLAAVDVRDSVDEVFADLRGARRRSSSSRDGRPDGVLTRSDLLEYLAHRRGELA